MLSECSHLLHIRSLEVIIGGHWRSLEVIGDHWGSLMSLIRLSRLIRLIRLDLQWRGRLQSYMWMDGMGLGRMDGMVIIGRR